LKTARDAPEKKPPAWWDGALIVFEGYVVAAFVVMGAAPLLYDIPDTDAIRGIVRGVIYGYVVSIAGLLVGAFAAWRLGKRRKSPWVALVYALFGGIVLAGLLPNLHGPYTK